MTEISGMHPAAYWAGLNPAMNVVVVVHCPANRKSGRRHTVAEVQETPSGRILKIWVHHAPSTKFDAAGVPPNAASTDLSTRDSFFRDIERRLAQRDRRGSKTSFIPHLLTDVPDADQSWTVACRCGVGRLTGEALRTGLETGTTLRATHITST